MAFSLLFFAGLFFVRTTYIRRACYRRASDIYYYHHRTASTAITAQYSTAQSTRATIKASTPRSERDNAGKQTELAPLEPACRRAYTQLAGFSKRTSKSKFSRPTKVTNHSQGSLDGVMRKGFFPVCTALSLRPFYFVHTCGVRVVFEDHGALAICKSLVVASLRDSVIRILSNSSL